MPGFVEPGELSQDAFERLAARPEVTQPRASTIRRPTVWAALAAASTKARPGSL